MTKIRWTVLGTILCVILGAGCQNVQNTGEYSRWMTSKEFSWWLKGNVEGKDVFVSGVEGRLANGKEQYRAKLCPAPENVEWYWFWWYGQNETFYQEQMQKLTKKDCFQLVSAQSFRDANCNSKYQMVFLKIINPQKSCNKNQGK